MNPYYQDDAVTIYHADCLEWRGWLEADFLVTDPPYGVAFSSGMTGHHRGEQIVNDEDASVRDAALALWLGPALVMGHWKVARPSSTRAVLTWEKGNHVGMGDLSIPWKPNTEEIYVLGSGFKGHRGSSVLRYLAVGGCVGTRNTGDRNHVTEKPVELFRDLLQKCSGVIVDPFMGSGTTLRAAKDLGLRAVGVEIEERLCRVAAARCAQEVLDFGTAA